MKNNGMKYIGKYTIEGNEYELIEISDYIEAMKKVFFCLEENKGFTEDEIYLKWGKENKYPCRFFQSIEEWVKTNRLKKSLEN